MKWPKIRRKFRLGLAEGISKLKLTMEKIDSASVIHIPIEISAKELHARITQQPQLNFIHIDHSDAGQKATDNIINLARRDPETKHKLVIMANAGFHLYTLREGVSSMVRHRRIPTLWRNAIAGEVSVDENLIFSKLDSPETCTGDPRLLVVFSSIAGEMYSPSLMRHFEQNFASIRKFIPNNTYILRIVDFGSVVGSFYLNSISLPENEKNIHNLISKTATKLSISNENITLYGGSKGGTAAAFYALRHGWRGVAADPILSDEYYIKKYNDSHFTVGTFASSKQQRFSEVLQNVHPAAQLSLICSTRSEQFPYIQAAMINDFSDRFLILNSENPQIRSHPDVGRNTIPHALSQINMHLAGISIPKGYHTVW